MAIILDRVQTVLEQLVHLPWRRWGQQYLRRALVFGSVMLMHVPIARLDPDGTDSGGDGEDEARAGTMSTMSTIPLPQHPPLPDVGTLARVWADEQAAQVAAKTTESLLSRPLRIEDVCGAAEKGQSGHDMPPSIALLALVTSTSLRGDEGESLQPRRLWTEPVVWDDGPGW